jgi:PKD repeat protein
LIEDPRLVVTYPATFIYEWELGDGTIKQGDWVEHTFPSTGEFEIFLNVTDILTGEVHKHAEHYLLIVEDVEQPYITISGDLRAGATISFDASNTFLPDIEIDEYYWMLGDGSRKTGIRTQHTYAAAGVYRVQLGVIGRSKYATNGEPEKFCVWIEIDVE